MRAQRGASLPLALLLFLICALLASVVISASSAEAGRHSQVAEMDQRYYSVTSAVGLVQKEFESQHVTVECTQAKSVTTPESYGSDGMVRHGTPSEKVESVALRVKTGDGAWKNVLDANGEEAARLNTAGLTLPELNALCVMFGGSLAEYADANAVWSASAFDGGSDAEDESTVVELGAYDLTPSIPSAAGSERALASVMRERLVDGGNLEIQFDSAVSGNSDIYSLTLVLDSNVDVIEEGEGTEPVVVAGAGGSARTERRTVTTTRTAELAWEPAALYKTGAVG